MNRACLLPNVVQISVRTHRIKDEPLERDLKLDRKRTKRWRRSSKGLAWYAQNRLSKLAYLRRWRERNRKRCEQYEIRKALKPMAASANTAKTIS